MLAVDAGGPRELISDGVDGLLRPARAQALAQALLTLAGSPALRAAARPRRAGSVEQRTWQRALDRLGDGYRRALAADERRRLRDAA